MALLARGATVVGVDRDPSAIEASTERLSRFGERFFAIEGNFGELERLLGERGLLPVDGVLLDLGVSSAQLSAKGRGFSFQVDGPLDMRMGREGPTAAEWIDRASERELADAIFRFGEERFSRQIARELKRARPATTLEAVRAVERAVPRRAWPKGIHVATRTFQALRIAVNRELEALSAALSSLQKVLRKDGVAAIISFHSLEDRMVKEAFRELSGRCRCPPGLPVCACGAIGDFELLTKKALVPSEAEVAENPRARSAKLRAVRRVR